jgi:hypothetical protein
LIVRANLALFHRVWLGYIDYDAAIRSGEIIMDGPRALTREFPRWFAWSPMAPIVRMERNRNATL